MTEIEKYPGLCFKIFLLTLAFMLAFTLPHLWMRIMQAVIVAPVLFVNIRRFWRLP